tara:strand:+ start:634 stop:915 length:282 start_codon:yes stop_codon:yes gene_type:complete
MQAQMLESMGHQDEPKDFIVLEENAEALDIFIFCQTQWRTSMSGPTGLDYTAVINVIATRHRKRKKQNQLLTDVHLIEQGALNAIARKKENGK